MIKYLTLKNLLIPSLISGGLILNDIISLTSNPIAFQRRLDLKLNNEHCLLPFWLASGTTATNLTVAIYFVNK